MLSVLAFSQSQSSFTFAPMTAKYSKDDLQANLKQLHSEILLVVTIETIK